MNDAGSFLQVVHDAVSGRVRYAVPGLKKNETLKGKIEKNLREIPGVKSVAADVWSGNTLVLFDPHLARKTIEDQILALVCPEPTEKKLSCAKKEKIKQTKRAKPLDGAKEKLARPWHTLSTGFVLSALEAQPMGLSSAEVAARRARYGNNVLPESEKRSIFSMLWEQVASLPNLLLFASAGISLATAGIFDAVIVLGVIGVNSVIGFFTEFKAEQTIDALTKLVHPYVMVLRDGVETEIPVEEVVVGDMVLLSPGSYVPADARLIEARQLSVDESALTGESLPVIKDTAPLDKEDVPLGDRINMLYMGTLVTSGLGKAVVVGVGESTELGMIQALVNSSERRQAPLQLHLERLSTQLVLASLAICGGMFAIGMVRGYPFLMMLKSTISLAVAAVPEGLPTVATTTLALGLVQLRRQKVLARHLPAVEALGAIEVLCLDKTGTLTLNKMTAVRANVFDEEYSIDNHLILDHAQKPVHHVSSAFQEFLKNLVLCNDSEISDKGFLGSATENALLELAILAGLDVAQLRQNYPRIAVQYRRENRNFMVTVHLMPDQTKHCAVKGSPPEVIALCNRIMKNGVIEPLSEDDSMAIRHINEQMAADALRVLGVAFTYSDEVPADDECPPLVWLGLVGLIDPLRPGVKEAIAEFHRAGIRTVMITGDQAPTAYAIGKALNLSQGEELQILDSMNIANMDPAMLTALAQKAHVFSRVSPANKLQIVQAFQRAGKVVGMTGDGVNDGPALKAADVGIAMGSSGTDVARNVADVILEEDELATMLHGIQQGRTIFVNIRKSLRFLLSTNFSEIMLMTTGVAIGIGAPLTAMQLLWINLVTDVLPALALSLEPAEADIMTRPPRDPKKPIIGGTDFKKLAFEGATLTTSALGAYLWGASRQGPAYGSALAFMSISNAQILDALTCRSESHHVLSRDIPRNPYLEKSLLLTGVLQVAAYTLPPLRAMLGTNMLGWADLGVITAAAALPVVMNEMSKGNPS